MREKKKYNLLYLMLPPEMPEIGELQDDGRKLLLRQILVDGPRHSRLSGSLDAES